MKTFLSWSGDKSHKVAIAFSEWIPCVVQAIEPWVSSKDIDRGSIWFNDIFLQLKETNFGIVFITKENQNKPWILFESGALSKGLTENRVCTVLIDLNVRDIDSGSPLRNLNHTTLHKESILALIKTINKNIESGQVVEKNLERSFEALWSEFEVIVQNILDSEPASLEPERQDTDVLNDILENVLLINRNVSRVIHHRSSGRHIEPHHAEALLNRLLKMDLERGDIEEAMEDVVPDFWVTKKLDIIFGVEPERN
jgi:hypothetical protein